jgi:lauroyl/myristoyl acyltransferase
LKRTVLAGLWLLAGIWPRTGLRVAHVLARLTGRFGFGIAPERLAEAFPDLPPDALLAVRRRTWAGFLKGEAIEAAMVRAGRRGYPPVRMNPAFAALEPPVILVTFHIGPYQAIGAALRLLPGDVVALTRDQYKRQADVTLLPGGENERQRVRAFRRALSTLRSPGFVLITVDAVTPGDYEVSSVEAPLLGGTILLARGAFALARISGAPVVPVIARWRGTELELVLGDAISPTLDETAMAAATAQWAESYLREFPGEVSVFVLERLRAPEPR